jgi:hypothetical protein
MAFELSKRQALLKTELMATAWQSHANFCSKLEEFSPGQTEPLPAIKAAHREYCVALRALEVFTSAIVKEQRKALRIQPQEWKKSRAADDVRFWITAYARFSATVAASLPSDELAYPSEGVLSAFEELPDSP